MTTLKDIQETVYGARTEWGVALRYKLDGVAVTRLEGDDVPIIWPIGSDLSASYEDPEGLFITEEDAQRLGIDVTDDD